MGLICSRPRCTCFSVAVSRPIKDMKSRIGQVGRTVFSVFSLAGSVTGLVWVRLDRT